MNALFAMEPGRESQVPDSRISSVLRCCKVPQGLLKWRSGRNGHRRSSSRLPARTPPSQFKKGSFTFFFPWSVFIHFPSTDNILYMCTYPGGHIPPHTTPPHRQYCSSPLGNPLPRVTKNVGKKEAEQEFSDQLSVAP